MAKNGKNSGHAGTLAEWKQRRRLDVTLPSGMPITMRTLTLDELAAEDGIPDDLVRIALMEMTPGGLVGQIAVELQKADKEALNRAKKLSEDNLRLRDRLCLRAILDPVMTAEDVAELDGFDKEMIAGIASRRIEFDAADRRVSGVTPISTFQLVADECGCGADCPARAKARELSAVYG